MTSSVHDDEAESLVGLGDETSEFLWAQPAQGRRGPKPKFSLDAIAEVAITIADDERLDAVTMQHVADRLGTTKMALYRYVPGRAELDAVILDRVLGEPEEPRGEDWRAVLTAWTHGMHSRVLSHPWSVELAQRPHTPGPRELAWFEAGLGAMSPLKLRGSEKLDLLALLVGHVMSLVRQLAATAAPEEALAAGLAPILAARAQDYPHTAAAFAEAAQEGAQDDALSFGIERILAGISALVAAR
ncbi:TetR/AcrR family transcriptional regulator [Leifsonia sp. A12D58]|uniref:TetR/AcrR family transcriptional regulator n=1 Tax=Leifsonia sp. A12D58 TaxID=3397674 RepID=UPI0039DFCD1D